MSSSSSAASSSLVPMMASTSSSHTISGISGMPSLSSLEMPSSRLFQFYMESFFKIPKDIKNDIIYCQRALKAHIKVHQMVLDVFQQQPDADPIQKKRILGELESEIYEINAEQNFLFLRLRRIIDEFLKMLKKNDIPTDINSTNAFISNEIIPLINDANVEIVPINVNFRNNEEKLIEKYFEVQKEEPQQQIPYYEIIDLDDDDVESVDEKIVKTSGKPRGGGNNRKQQLSNALLMSPPTSMNGESLLKNLNTNTQIAQPSLLKPMNQRITNDIMSVDVKQSTTLSDIYRSKKEEKSMELPVSTNVKMSRFNLRQALQRAQAAVRGPTAIATTSAPPPPPPPQASSSSSSSSSALALGNTESVVKKSASTKTRNTRAAVAAAAAATTVSTTSRKSPKPSSSSEEGTPERGNTPLHNYWPDELEETRTKAEEYGQEMFLKIFDLFTPEVQAKLQQRRSKRRRRCVQNNNYHYGRIEHHPTSSVNEPETKKKRKAFLLSPQVKKTLPAKRSKRRSADNASETTSVPPSRSNSSSPNDKRTCNECLKGGNNLEQCEECKFYYHARCHREDDDQMLGEDPKKSLSAMKKCPGCKRKYNKIINEGILLNKNLQRCAQELELQYAKEKDRHEILQRTSKSYKIQMNNLYDIVNSIKSDPTSSASSSTITAPYTIIEAMTCGNSNNVINLD